MQTALLSASNKTSALARFAQGLVSLGWNILASAGTKKFLDEHSLPSTDVGDIVGPPILGHRVVTLDRKIYAAILARPEKEDDMAELKRLGIEPISLMYVDLYPLAAELRSPESTHRSVLDKIDIGGPTLLRAAAKGGCFVLCEEKQMSGVLDFLRLQSENKRNIVATNRFRAGLAAQAELKVSEYASLAASFYDSLESGAFPHKWRQKVA
jgi:phosphoribosylaminoimidazolecarboxamide formyltransferase/IMP cyclohydrolase